MFFSKFPANPLCCVVLCCVVLCCVVLCCVVLCCVVLCCDSTSCAQCGLLYYFILFSLIKGRALQFNGL